MEASDRELRRCPRCAAGIFEVGRGASSRAIRDAGVVVEICPRCGERESLYGYDLAAQAPLTSWPLSVEHLVEEERILLMRDQVLEEPEENGAA